MPKDELSIEILEDGRIKVTANGQIGAAHHASADQLYKLIATLGGGEVTKEKVKHAHTHSHTHETAKAEEK